MSKIMPEIITTVEFEEMIVWEVNGEELMLVANHGVQKTDPVSSGFTVEWLKNWGTTRGCLTVYPKEIVGDQWHRQKKLDDENEFDYENLNPKDHQNAAKAIQMWLENSSSITVEAKDRAMAILALAAYRRRS